MQTPDYDKSSVKSIYEFAIRLIGRSLKEATSIPANVINSKNRGNLGRFVEIYYFQHNPPNNRKPDFDEAGLELKTTGILDYKKATKTGEVIKAKERMKLTEINYKTIEFEEWETSTLIQKCNLTLILFYKFDSSVSVIEQKFILKPLLISLILPKLNLSPTELAFVNENALQISDMDLERIKQDWELIRQKIVDLRAHELSEGDTWYLGACRSGTGGANETLKLQNGSEIGAKSRSFAFKQSFLTKLVQGHSKNEVSIVSPEILTFELAIQQKFSPFIGMTVDEISKNLKYFTKSKSQKYLLARRILAHSGKKIEELVKAGIELKTFSLTKSGKSREDLSFPAFKSSDITVQVWDESDFSNQIENKFLFVVFQEDESGEDRLVKVLFWNMPYQDRLEAKRVWEETKRRLLINPRDLPRKSESTVSHVRPHARNKMDYDLSSNGKQIVKRCFWLNGSYIAGQISQ